MESEPRLAKFVGISLVVLLVCRIVGFWTFPVYDDAFITYRYGMNLAEGKGLVYNVGEWVMGSTTPAFALLASVFHFLPGPLTAYFLVLNLLADLGIAVLAIGVLKRANLRSAIPPLLAILSVSPILNRVCAGGMEVNLFVFLTLLVVSMSARGPNLAAIGISALLYFVRPEAVVVTGVLVLDSLIRRWPVGLFHGAIAALLPMPFLYMMWQTYGHFLPQSVIAKSGIHSHITDVIGKMIFPDPLSVITFPLAIIGGRIAWRSASRELRMILGIAGLYIAAYLIRRPFVWSWYAEMVQVCIALFAGVALSVIADRWMKNHSAQKFLRPAYAFMPLIAWLIIAGVSGPDPISSGIYRPLQKWADSAKVANDLILAGDIGIVGFTTKARIFDAEKLVSPEAMRFSSIVEMIQEKRPDYLFLVANAESIEALDALRGNTNLDYTPIRRFSKTGDTTTTQVPELYRRGWLQDYILYERSQ